jgi:hypothetical protein
MQKLQGIVNITSAYFLHAWGLNTTSLRLSLFMKMKTF